MGFANCLKNIVNMLYYKDLENKVLESPSMPGTNGLFIISGYVGVQPIQKLEDLPSGVHATVIYGMYGSDNISAPLHEALLELQTKLHNVDIFYSTVPVHSKIYFWKDGDEITKALIGSANFTVNGLRNDYREVLADVDEKSFADFISYYQYVKERSIPCTDNGVVIKTVKKYARTSMKRQPLIAQGICRASFLDNKGLVPKGSGLNWGFGKAHNQHDVAYIPIKAEYIKSFPNLFPPKKYVFGIENVNSKGKKNRENDEIELIWDDGTVMMGLLEGQGVKANGHIYPKQLSSSSQKSILGKYLRKRIGVDVDHLICKRDLLKYGRTHIDISLIGDGLYYMDFSVKK